MGTYEEAFDRLQGALDGRGGRDYRFCYEDDEPELARYAAAMRRAAGSGVDLEITLHGRPALIGCNAAG